jgi:vacuolar-type H+-ATPase subunit H
MPDESTAATEHAILQEVTAPLATLPDDPVPDVADVDFPITLRGYDRLAVDAYVKRTSQLVAELQATRSPEAAVRRGLERVGEEVAGILQRAHEAAGQITVQSRSDAEDRLERARQEALRITADAERRLEELDAETDRIWAERQRIVEDAQQLAQQLLTLAQSAAARFPAAEDPDAIQGADPDEFDEADFVQSADGASGDLPDSEDPAAVVEQLAGGDRDDPDDAESTRVMPPIPPPHEDESD